MKSYNCENKSKYINSISFSFIENNNKRIQERILIDFKNGSLFEYLFGLNYCGIEGEKFYNEFISSNDIDSFFNKKVFGKIEYKKLK